MSTPVLYNDDNYHTDEDGCKRVLGDLLKCWDPNAASYRHFKFSVYQGAGAFVLFLNKKVFGVKEGTFQEQKLVKQFEDYV